jgi:hypothetical protein
MQRSEPEEAIGHSSPKIAATAWNSPKLEETEVSG